MVDTVAFKQKFLKGDQNLVRYYQEMPKVTQYQTSHRGLQATTDQLGKILDHGRTSFVGQTVPDPTLMM